MLSLYIIEYFCSKIPSFWKIDQCVCWDGIELLLDLKSQGNALSTCCSYCRLREPFIAEQIMMSKFLLWVYLLLLLWEYPRSYDDQIIIVQYGNAIYNRQYAFHQDKRLVLTLAVLFFLWFFRCTILWFWIEIIWLSLIWKKRDQKSIIILQFGAALFGIDKLWNLVD